MTPRGHHDTLAKSPDPDTSAWGQRLLAQSERLANLATLLRPIRPQKHKRHDNIAAPSYPPPPNTRRKSGFTLSPPAAHLRQTHLTLVQADHGQRGAHFERPDEAPPGIGHRPRPATPGIRRGRGITSFFLDCCLGWDRQKPIPASWSSGRPQTRTGENVPLDCPNSRVSH